MLREIVYTWVVNKGKIADYFESNYLDYQRIHGRMSLTNFAKDLHISKGFLSQLMAGTATTMKYQTAVFIAAVLGDDSLLDLLGYEAPGSPLALLPSDARSALQDAMNKISSLGMDADSPEAHKIFDDTMIALGYVKISTRNSESAE